jgi:hypothetical protein
MADETLSTELNTLITKHLPAQVGAALQERLKKAEEDAKLVLQLRHEVAAQKQTIELWVAHKNKYDKIIEREDAVKVREDAVKEEQREISHREQLAEIKIESAKESKLDVLRLVGQIFATPTFKRVLAHSASEHMPIMSPGSSYPTMHQRTSSETTTEEVTNGVRQP